MSEILNAVREAAILIPSLEPDERLPAYIRELEKSGFGNIIVVDDGSSEAFPLRCFFCIRNESRRT